MRKFFLLTGCVWTMLFTACDNTDYSDHSPFDNSAYLSVAEIRNVESFTFNRRVTEQTKKFTALLWQMRTMQRMILSMKYCPPGIIS